MRRSGHDHPGRGLGAADAWHVQVHHDHVGCEHAELRQRVVAGLRLPDHVDPLALEQAAETAPEQVVVIDQQDTQ